MGDPAGDSLQGNETFRSALRTHLIEIQQSEGAMSHLFTLWEFQPLRSQTFLLSIAAVLTLACAQGPALAAEEAGAVLVPAVDHHQHLLSPAGAKRDDDPPLPAVDLPGDLARLLRAREKGWNDKAALAGLYTEDSVLLDDREHGWIKGREAVAGYSSGRFARAYQVMPIAYAVEGSVGSISAYFTRGEGESLKRFGSVHLSLKKGGDGAWRIAAETPVFPGPAVREPLDARQLVAYLDEAGIRRAVVLSVAYWYGSPLGKPVEDEYTKVRAENDWTVAQVAQFPDRLVAFCSFNPLKDYALQEIDRCARDLHVKGLKLHFGNSGVDVKNPEHVEKLRRVFRAANERRLAIVAHLWTLDESYGRKDAEAFLSQILPEAPDVVVQIAHMAGGGPGWTDSALEVYADAVAAGDPRTRNLYFDIATVADSQSGEDLKLLAKRIRQIGPRRILYGSDAAFGGRSTPRQEWGTFRGMVPLTEAELQTIAGNVAPYLK
jgi:predicted TIM-barrel fold metal-dependent hydrolase